MIPKVLAIAIFAIVLTVVAVEAKAKPAAAGVEQQEQEYKSYNGWVVIRATATDMKEGMALVELQRNNPDIDFWKEPSVTEDTDFMVSPQKLDSVISYLNIHGIKFDIIIKDVGQLIASQEPFAPKSNEITELNWTSYQSLETLYEWLANVSAANSYADLITIGNSYQGRELKVLRLSKNLTARNPAIFIDSTIHAREWITPATVTWIINQLITNPADNQLLDNVDFYFLPVINPDGYSYSYTTSRLWRKTRSNNGANCFGVDANRNFDYEWNNPNCPSCSSGTCTSDIFRGPTAFSEPETLAMRNYIVNQTAAGVNFQSYISVHSYGQYFMHPWGYTSNPPVDNAELQMLGDYVGGNITSLYGTRYRTGSSSTTIYPTDGSSQDWAYGSGIFKYAYTAELRDTGAYGFLLPAAQIIPTAQETWAGFRVVAQYIIGRTK